MVISFGKKIMFCYMWKKVKYFFPHITEHYHTSFSKDTEKTDIKCQYESEDRFLSRI